MAMNTADHIDASESREPGEPWYENTLRHAEGPRFPADCLGDRLLDAFAEVLRSDPGKAILEMMQKVCLLHGLRIAGFLYQLPQPKAQAFLWKYIDRLSDREIGRKLGVDHKTVAAWCREIARALPNPQWGGKYDEE